jgi:hypothetical protein
MIGAKRQHEFMEEEHNFNQDIFDEEDMISG